MAIRRLGDDLRVVIWLFIFNGGWHLLGEVGFVLF